jgi:formylglycine-generating enzyme required for sulfatase activity
MGRHHWQKLIAIVVLLAFVGMGIAWTAEPAVPQFQEKEGSPIVRKHNKFPWLPVILGVGAGVVLVVLLTRKKEQKHTLTINLGAGVSGTPKSTASYGNGQVVKYSYTAPAGNGGLEVRLDNDLVAASGMLTMNADHTLSVSVNAANNVNLTYSNGVLTANGIRYELVLIPSGLFQMGSDCQEAYPDEQPIHAVTISMPFWFGRTEVTQGLWQAVMGSNPAYFKKGDNYPVETITNEDCLLFIDKVNQMLGGNFFRLPTEAEWEYACRAGSTAERYGDIDAIAWHNGNAGSESHPVGRKQPNAFGLYDMLGNVGEICQDRYGPYSSMDQTDPAGPTSGNLRTRRGAGFSGPPECIRSARRGIYSPSYCCASLGFRLARTNE